MNEITQKQIDNLLKEFDMTPDSDGFYIITKKPPEESPFSPGKRLKVVLKSYIVNEPPNFTLSKQWNKGMKFKSANMTVYVNKVNGSMLNVSGHDDIGNLVLEMWIPQGGIEEYEVIN